MNQKRKYPIEDKDISIVVQGPILLKSKFDITNETTKLVCNRIRKLFPEGEIILSTWKGSDVKGISYDKLILSKDPGASSFIFGDDKIYNNCNRLITSTQNGIKVASRKCDVLLTPKYIFHKIQMLWRPVWFCAFKAVLILINGKHEKIKKLVSYYIKKISS